MGQIQDYLGRMAEMIHNIRGVQPGYKYTSLEAYVSANGREYISARLNDSQMKHVMRVAAKCVMQGIRFQPKECFYNAQLLVHADNENRLQYVEGYGVHGFFPMLHGWAAIGGKVVDLTWTHDREYLGFPGSRILGEFPTDMAYFGVSFTREAIRKSLSEGMAKSLIDDMKNEYPLLRGDTDGDRDDHGQVRQGNTSVQGQPAAEGDTQGAGPQTKTQPQPRRQVPREPRRLSGGSRKKAKA